MASGWESEGPGLKKPTAPNNLLQGAPTPYLHFPS